MQQVYKHTLDVFHVIIQAPPPAVSMTDGLQLLVQLMTAAMTTEPCTSWYSWPQWRKATRVSCFSLEMWKPLKPTWDGESRLWGARDGVLAWLNPPREFLSGSPSRRDSSGSLPSCCWLPPGPEAFWDRWRGAPWSSGWSRSPAGTSMLFYQFVVWRENIIEEQILGRLPQSTEGLHKVLHSFGKVWSPSCKTPSIQVFHGWNLQQWFKQLRSKNS